MLRAPKVFEKTTSNENKFVFKVDETKVEVTTKNSIDWIVNVKDANDDFLKCLIYVLDNIFIEIRKQDKECRVLRFIFEDNIDKIFDTIDNFKFNAYVLRYFFMHVNTSKKTNELKLIHANKFVNIVFPTIYIIWKRDIKKISLDENKKVSVYEPLGIGIIRDKSSSIKYGIDMEILVSKDGASLDNFIELKEFEDRYEFSTAYNIEQVSYKEQD